MNLPATQTRQLSPVEHYTLQVIGDERHEADLWSALPEHIRPERFKRTMINLFLQKPELLKCDPRSVYREVSKAAALGLVLDPQLGEAYIITAWNGTSKQPELRCGYRGIMKLARQSTEIANLYPVEVCENDHFVHEEGIGRRLEHRIDDRKPRGKPFCYYTVVIYKDGTHDFEVMSMEALYRIRDQSDAWKAFKAGKIKSTPWADHEGEMCKKTVIKRLLKRVPQSPELSDAMAMEDAADFAPNAPRLLPQQQIHQLRVIETPSTELDDQSSDIPDDFGDVPDAPAIVSLEQLKVLIELANEVGADKPKFCQWLGVSSLPEIPANQFDLAVRALEAKRRQAEQAPSAADSSSVAEQPAAIAPAGKPAPSAPADGAGPDPIAEARQAGRDACDASVDYNAVPAEFSRYLSTRKAWAAGYEERAAEIEAEMNSDGIDQEFGAAKQRSIAQLKRDMRQD